MSLKGNFDADGQVGSTAGGTIWRNKIHNSFSEDKVIGILNYFLRHIWDLYGPKR